LELQAKIDEWRGQDMTAAIAVANQHLPFWVSLSLVVAIAWYLAKIFWALFPAPAIAPAPLAMGQRPASTISAKPATNAHESIVNTHIFGESTANDVALPVQTAEDAPETRLNLKLHGAIQSTDPTKAHAIISEAGKTSEVYFTGDPIPGGAKLHEVQITQVIISRDGILETLKLPDIAKGETVVNREPASTARRNFGPRTVRQDQGDDQADGMARFTDIVRPQPYMPDGTLKGYRLYPGRDRKAFAAMGLRPGDLVTDINGVPLTDMSQGMALFQSLGDATQLTVTVERNGQPQVLTLDTSDMMNKDDTLQ
jgi:general secretion pathway protein C